MTMLLLLFGWVHSSSFSKQHYIPNVALGGIGLSDRSDARFASLRLRLYGDHRLHPTERPETAIDGDDNAGDEACARPTQPDRR